MADRMITTQTVKVRHFRSLHSSVRPLALADAWVASARIIEAAGAPVIAATSVGVAWLRDRSVPVDRSRLPA